MSSQILPMVTPSIMPISLLSVRVKSCSIRSGHGFPEGTEGGSTCASPGI